MRSPLRPSRRPGRHPARLAAAVGAAVAAGLAVGLLVSRPLGDGAGRWLAVAAVQVPLSALCAAGLVRRSSPGGGNGVDLDPPADAPRLLAAVDRPGGLSEAAPLHGAGPADVAAALARLRFDDRLERALDAVRNEDELLGVAARAAESLTPPGPTELLLVGAGGSAMVQAAESGPGGEGPGCPVPEAEECEAVRTGQTRRYEYSSGFDACPHLRGRASGPCSAVCVPVRVLGRSIGVVHRTGPEGEPPPAEVTSSLESLASKAGARLAVLRAAGAGPASTVDPETGALDRASVEARILDLARDLTPFSLAQADVDHFQPYVRTFGPAAAERVLRVVAATLADILRPTDLVGRFGDDEFLIVLPHAAQGEASRALERARESLALRLAGSNLPPFTVSFGVVESAFGQSLDELLVAADVAVSLAKDLGRNRVVVAGEQLIDPLGDEAGL